MAKTKEELNTLKQEYESLTSKLKELTEEELKQVTGGDVTSSKVVANSYENAAGLGEGYRIVD